jgi:predicted RNA binding protein YcfA (HicA-like mRNA interferase family)
VAQWEKVLRRILDGHADNNIRFTDLRGLLKRLGFAERIEGSHHVYDKDGVRQIIDLQPRHDGKAKGYQVKQVRSVLRDNGLTALP